MIGAKPFAAILRRKRDTTCTCRFSLCHQTDTENKGCGLCHRFDGSCPNFFPEFRRGPQHAVPCNGHGYQAGHTLEECMHISGHTQSLHKACQQVEFLRQHMHHHKQILPGPIQYNETDQDSIQCSLSSQHLKAANARRNNAGPMCGPTSVPHSPLDKPHF